jgi:polyisoprenyl-phosphate glycosyltransferase
MGLPAPKEPMNVALQARTHTPSISLVVPAYNEEAVLDAFYERASAVLKSLNTPYEIVFVNDGSRDATLAILRRYAAQDGCISVVDLSRNYGKEIALTAGLDHCAGDVIIAIDADLQDPPELIPQMIDAWKEGYDVAYAVRTERDGESWLKRSTAHVFYRLLQSTGRVKIPVDTGDFRLMSRRANEAVQHMREHHRYMKGIFAWVGFPSKAIYYKRDARAAGETKIGYGKLWNLAVEGITSFTTAPLKLASYVGLSVAMLAFAYAAYVIYKTIRFGDPVQGYPSMMVIVLFLGGVQLVCIGILGEYLGRIFNEVKQRPLYFLSDMQPSELARKQLQQRLQQPSSPVLPQ